MPSNSCTFQFEFYLILLHAYLNDVQAIFCAVGMAKILSKEKRLTCLRIVAKVAF